MKLEEFERQKARNFVISWTVIYCFFCLVVFWTLNLQFEMREIPTYPVSMIWPHTFLILIVLLSLFAGIIGMWSKYLSGEFGKIRKMRNISFIVVLFVFPIGVILNLIMAAYG